MTRYNPPFEIHLHGDVPLRDDVVFAQIQDALKPLWQYAGARSLAAAAESAYEDEPGIRFDAEGHVLNICWTVPGDDDFRQVMEETCMGLNDIASAGAPLEVSFYDTEYDDEDAPETGDEAEARDDFMMCFVGPTPAAILQVQRDLMVQDVVHIMERHFDASELGGVVTAIDQLFAQRFDALVSSMHLGKPPRGHGGSSGHGGGRKPRHLH